jgi:two-component system nitrogen regulation response regulator NtrX
MFDSVSTGLSSIREQETAMSQILVIDDEIDIRKTLKEILESEMFTVEEAEDGAAGVEMAKEGKYEIILCDVRMPEMDGIEVLQRINEIIPETPVIMISGYGNISTAVESLKKGAYDYIEKPFDLKRLLVTIRHAMDKPGRITETKSGGNLD